MTEKKPALFLMTGVFAVTFLFGAAVMFGSYRWSERLFYDKMAAVAASFPGQGPDIMQALKDTKECDLGAGKEILRRYGYEGRLPAEGRYLEFGAGSLLFAGICTLAVFFYLYQGGRKLQKRVKYLTEYLRQVEEGDYSLSMEKGQDVFSNLEDEIYKTVLALRESREKLKRDKEKLSDNLADISHQLKTPLTSLLVLGELLHRRLSGTEDAALVGRMEGQTQRLADLAAALLTRSRADAGVLFFEKRPVPVSELIECSLEPVRPLLEKRGQEVKVLGAGNPPQDSEPEDFFLLCDLGWTREALGNLLKNASEHSPGQSTIRIRVWDNPVFTGIAVEDQGPGFSAKDLRHLFDRFYRGEKAGGDGTGIGLSLARSLIESQDGEIRAENRKDGGARFLIKFYKNV